MDPCDCGKPAVGICADIEPEGIKLVRCRKPVCMRNAWCDKHRHQSGTMGYPDWGKTPKVVTWWGYDPEEPGLWPWLKARFFTWTASPKKAAQRAWEDVQRGFAPDAPLPPLRIKVRNRVFECNSDGSVTELEFPFNV